MSSDSIMVRSEALADRLRGTLARAPSSIAARTDQTEPGMYLPSCPMNKMRPATVVRSGEPSPASSTCQAFRVPYCTPSSASSAYKRGNEADLGERVLDSVPFLR